MEMFGLWGTSTSGLKFKAPFRHGSSILGPLEPFLVGQVRGKGDECYLGGFKKLVGWKGWEVYCLAEKWDFFIPGCRIFGCRLVRHVTLALRSCICQKNFKTGHGPRLFERSAFNGFFIPGVFGSMSPIWYELIVANFWFVHFQQDSNHLVEVGLGSWCHNVILEI